MSLQPMQESTLKQTHPEYSSHAGAEEKYEKVLIWADHNPPFYTTPVLFRADKVEEWGEESS